MGISIWFWLAMFCWLVFSLFAGYRQAPEIRWTAGGSSLLLFVLFALLGWATFGGPIK